MRCYSYSITQSAARFLSTVAPDVVPGPEAESCYRFTLQNTPRVRQALAQALERSRARSVRSSLRAALARFDPEAVPARAKPGASTGGLRLFIMYKRPRARTYLVQGTATAEGSLGTLQAFIKGCTGTGSSDGPRGRVRVVEARTARHARERIAQYELGAWRPGMVAGAGDSTGPRDARVLGLGVAGALAVWAALGADERRAWADGDRAMSPEAFKAWSSSAQG